MEDAGLDREAIAARLRTFGDDEALELARQFLQDPKAQPVFRPFHTQAAQLLAVWPARIRNTELTGRKLFGAAALVAGLRELDASLEISVHAAETREMVGLFFFRKDDEKLIGLVLTERPDPRIAQESWKSAMGETEEPSNL